MSARSLFFSMHGVVLGSCFSWVDSLRLVQGCGCFVQVAFLPRVCGLHEAISLEILYGPTRNLKLGWTMVPVEKEVLVWVQNFTSLEVRHGKTTAAEKQH